MPKIIGNTTATPNPRPDWNQTDETKADFIKNKPTILTEEDVVELIGVNGGTGSTGGGMSIVVTDQLPTENINDTTLYLVGGVTNAIPSATDDMDDIFNNTGYKNNAKWSQSLGEDVPAEGIDITGYIPVKAGDTIHLENIGINRTDVDNPCILFFINEDYYKAYRSYYANELEDIIPIWENNTLVGFEVPPTTTPITHMRIQAAGINENSIIFINWEENNIYTEYIYVNGEWEQVGGNTKVPYELTQQVRLNTKARHTHNNGVILDKFNIDENDDITFNGKTLAEKDELANYRLAKDIISSAEVQYSNSLLENDRTRLKFALDEIVTDVKTSLPTLESNSHTHGNQESILDKLSLDDNGGLLFDEKPITSDGSGGSTTIDPRVTMAQTVIALLENTENLVCFDSPEVASDEFGGFANAIFELKSEGYKLFYAPPKAGTLTYVDAFHYESVSMKVTDGEIYEFYGDPNAEHPSGLGAICYNKYAGTDILVFFKTKLLN